MTRLIRAEFRKLATVWLWLWILLAAVVWAAAYTAVTITFSGRSGNLTVPLSGAAGQHALLAIGAGGAGPLAAVLGAIAMTSEYRHRTGTVTFLATPARGRVITAKLITYLLAGAGYGLACDLISLAVALPWLAARGIRLPIAGHGNLAVLAAVVASAAIFAAAGIGLGALTGSQLATVTGILIYLYAAEPLVTHIGALHTWTAYLPGVAADGLTQATQAGVTLLAPWLGGIVLAGWAAAFAAAGGLRTLHRDIS